MTYHNLEREAWRRVKRLTTSSIPRHSAPIPGVTAYIVHYDLPADARRKRFYRRLRKYRMDHYIDEDPWASQSVIVTTNKEFAWAVYRFARRVSGVVHIYEARQLDTEP